MPQNAPNAVLAAVNSVGLQAPTTLGTPGNLVGIGNPGGPAIFSILGAYIVPAISGGFPRSIVGTSK